MFEAIKIAALFRCACSSTYDLNNNVYLKTAIHAITRVNATEVYIYWLRNNRDLDAFTFFLAEIVDKPELKSLVANKEV